MTEHRSKAAASFGVSKFAVTLVIPTKKPPPKGRPLTERKVCAMFESLPYHGANAAGAIRNAADGECHFAFGRKMKQRKKLSLDIRREKFRRVMEAYKRNKFSGQARLDLFFVEAPDFSSISEKFGVLLHWLDLEIMRNRTEGLEHCHSLAKSICNDVAEFSNKKLPA
ncbi:MAG: hypothetical protein K2Y27_00900 [Xanthobacteraceae bacterium]|nr:hypothetical protein [Xanthobacteraceae bacterium]